MQNSTLFINAFNSIEQYLRRQTHSDKRVSFYDMVRIVSKSDAVVRRYERDLREYGDLRNAIIHESSDGHVIAEPNDLAVSDLGRLRSLLINPPKVIPKFQVKVHTREASQALGEAVAVMLAGTFSQLPVIEEGSVIGVLTANTIARWLGHEVANDVFSLRETTIAQVLQYTEDPENHCFLDRTATLFGALARFEDFTARGKDLDAILLTHNGRANEALLGILTLYDLPKILELLGLTSLSAA